MRIRSTKPEFWTSKTIAALPWDIRLVLKGLESYVDDNGVGKDDLALIASDVFPRDLVASPRETLARLSEAISNLSDAGLIARYEHDGEDLLYIDKWKQLQRIDKPAKGRFPRPDGTLEYSEEVNRDTYRSPRDILASPPEKVAPGTGEQGNRGTGENTPSSADADGPSSRIDDDFAEWYEMYPRKVGKQGAVKAYRRARKTATAEDLLSGLRSQLPKLQTAEERFRPHPATWLNEGRWEDVESNSATQSDDSGWLQPWVPPAAPAEIADDPSRYAEWLDEQRKAAGR